MSNPTMHTVIDVRDLPSCYDRHAAIFNTFDNLSSGEALEIIAPHDPAHLKGKFEEQRAGQSMWEYVECGPDVWRVRIGRL